MNFWGGEGLGGVHGFNNIFDHIYGKTTATTKTKNFEKYREEIQKTRVYIKSQREAFYRNNNLKER